MLDRAVALLAAMGQWLRRRASPPNVTLLASLVLAGGLCALVVDLLLEARRDAWRVAEREVQNLHRLVARDLARNLELFDLSLRAAAENILVPGVAELPHEIRQMVLFDRALTASHVGLVLGTDAEGVVRFATEAGALGASVADRDYFVAQRDAPGLGLYISRPQQGRLSGEPSIMLSRRREDALGNFAGVVAVTIRLSYFRELFANLVLGPEALLAVTRIDGLLLVRMPFRSSQLGRDLSGGEAFRRVMNGETGTFIATSAVDGVRRLYAGGRVGSLPLTVLAGDAVSTIEAGWLRKAVIELGATLLLAAGLVALSLFWRHALRRLQQAEDRFRLLAENSGDMVSRLDLNLTRLYASPATRRVMGRDPAEMTGRRTLDDIDPRDRNAVQAAMARLRDGVAEETTLTYRVLRPDLPPAGEFWVEGTVRLTRNLATGAPDGYVAISRDITGRRREEEELARARDAAEAASRAKSRFLSMMSHELRTPLNVILGYAQVLGLDAALRDSQRQQLAAMEAAGRHLLEMISGILDFSRIEAGQVELRPVPTALAPLLEGCLELARQQAIERGLSLEFRALARAPEVAVLDPVRVRQILLNLLGNAVKFTERGGVSLRLAAAGPAMLRVEVADTGSGITAERRARLFQEFERLGAEESGTVQGSGLGLAISARLATLMGGQLGYTDNQGGGSVFWLELPLRPI